MTVCGPEGENWLTRPSEIWKPIAIGAGVALPIALALNYLAKASRMVTIGSSLGAFTITTLTAGMLGGKKVTTPTPPSSDPTWVDNMKAKLTELKMEDLHGKVDESKLDELTLAIMEKHCGHAAPAPQTKRGIDCFDARPIHLVTFTKEELKDLTTDILDAQVKAQLADYVEHDGQWILKTQREGYKLRTHLEDEGIAHDTVPLDFDPTDNAHLNQVSQKIAESVGGTQAHKAFTLTFDGQTFEANAEPDYTGISWSGRELLMLDEAAVKKAIDATIGKITLDNGSVLYMERAEFDKLLVAAGMLISGDVRVGGPITVNADGTITCDITDASGTVANTSGDQIQIEEKKAPAEPTWKKEIGDILRASGLPNLDDALAEAEGNLDDFETAKELSGKFVRKALKGKAHKIQAGAKEFQGRERPNLLLVRDNWYSLTKEKLDALVAENWVKVDLGFGNSTWLEKDQARVAVELAHPGQTVKSFSELKYVGGQLTGAIELEAPPPLESKEQQIQERVLAELNLDVSGLDSPEEISAAILRHHLGVDEEERELKVGDASYKGNTHPAIVFTEAELLIITQAWLEDQLKEAPFVPFDDGVSVHPVWIPLADANKVTWGDCSNRADALDIQKMRRETIQKRLEAAGVTMTQSLQKIFGSPRVDFSHSWPRDHLAKVLFQEQHGFSPKKTLVFKWGQQGVSSVAGYQSKDECAPTFSLEELKGLTQASLEEKMKAAGPSVQLTYKRIPTMGKTTEEIVYLRPIDAQKLLLRFGGKTVEFHDIEGGKLTFSQNGQLAPEYSLTGELTRAGQTVEIDNPEKSRDWKLEVN